jgi:hypothetical protein
LETALAKPFSVEITEKTEDAVKSAVKTLHAMMSWDGTTPYPQQKMLVELEQPIRVRINRRKEKWLSQMKVRFFENQGNLCYTFHLRTGFYVPYDMFQTIKRITIFPRADRAESNRKAASQLMKKIHPNAWSYMDEERVLQLVENYGSSTTNIKGKFPPHVHEALVDAFENKKDYSFKTCGKARDLSVSTKVGEDGVLRAWFSSEFAGCGNGDYWILLNPTTAAFKERD